MKPSFVKIFVGDALAYKTLELLRIGRFFAEDQKATEVSRLILPPTPPPPPRPNSAWSGRAAQRIDLPRP